MNDPSPPTSAHSLIVATAGHVDHGKSSLVKALTGRDTDTLQEEIARGLTINLGYAYSRCERPGRAPLWLGFVDVPGHRDFINNMLAGVAAVEAALLVVAADDGIMPQTREHLDILNLLGIDRAVVALSKIDRCPDTRTQTVSGEIRALLAETALTNAPIVPVSSHDGSGIEALREALMALSADRDDPAPGSEQYFRFLVDRSFTVRGAGTVVTGTAVAGHAAVGDSLTHSDSGESCRIRGIRLHDQTLQSIQAGQRAALNVTLAQDAVGRGDWLSDAPRHRPAPRFDASLRLLQREMAPQSGTQYHLYVGATHRLARLRLLSRDDCPLVQVNCDEPVHVFHGDRFIVRDPADQFTLAGGRVLDRLVPARRRASPERLQALAAQTESPVNCLRQLLRVPPGLIDLARFAVNRNLTEAALARVVDELESTTPGVVRLEAPDGPAFLLSGDTLEAWRQAVTAWLEEFHRRHPAKQGVADSQLCAADLCDGAVQACHAAIAYWLREGVLQRSGSLLHLPGHRPRLGEAESQFMTRIRPLLAEAGRVPPRTRELVESTGIPLGRLEKLLRELTRSGHLVQVADNRHFLPETLIELAEFTQQLAEETGRARGFTVIQFRDASGIGRNLCIEILEYFDRAGFTRRQDNVRLIRTDPARAFSFHPDH